MHGWPQPIGRCRRRCRRTGWSNPLAEFPGLAAERTDQEARRCAVAELERRRRHQWSAPLLSSHAPGGVRRIWPARVDRGQFAEVRCGRRKTGSCRDWAERPGWSRPARELTCETLETPVRVGISRSACRPRAQEPMATTAAASAAHSCGQIDRGACRRSCNECRRPWIWRSPPR